MSVEQFLNPMHPTNAGSKHHQRTRPAAGNFRARNTKKMKVKTIIATVAICAAVSTPAKAADLYVATIHMVQTDGEYKTYQLTGTEQGVSRIECEIRVELWKEKFDTPLINRLVQEELRKQGKQGGMRINCERKE